ncbi:peroxide stress protein YaaA [Caulobacter sp. 17J80-11]|uniref:peroxide stress protein YaaA n=1 Tax=Caulobacter sp. 17J80-11 TaxID=2763502 RepID=UPI0016537035|nr:peroxide stress protein YaaA [Caulobacter sp. 17J80-11]MBC6983061.1 peroxide stress protein YaaA [Caulobacter sp. 17J80-11]
MLIVLSPAKSLDFTPAPAEVPSTKPELKADTAELVEVARKLTRSDLRSLMHISEKLADLNFERFQAFKGKAKVQAALAFAGDVYDGLDARSLDLASLEWAQDHLRILSGLYGVLRPLDCIEPYRLEMGARLRTERGTTLYDFWGAKIAERLNKVAAKHTDPTLVNLASQEYFGAVDARALKLPLVNIRFLEDKDGDARVISFYAKKARGLMARYAIENRIEIAVGLKRFDVAGYRFDEAGSTEADWTFVRRHP